jgi:hypothetical protein
MPSRFYNWFDEQLHAVAWQQTKALNWFMGFPGTRATTGLSGINAKLDGGLIRSVEEGLENVITWKWEQMQPGQIAASLQEAPRQTPRITELTGPLMYLATKLVFPLQQVDAWRNNKYLAAEQLIPAALRQAMLPLTNQVDQFLWFGMDMKDPLSWDRLTGGGKFTGLLNGFTTFVAPAAGGDSDLGDKGDLRNTYVTARNALVTAGYDTGPYYVLSDYTTKTAFEQNNHLYTSGTKPYSSYGAFMGEYKYKQGEVADWINSINAHPGSSSSKNTWALTQPYLSQQGKRLEPNYLLYMGYNYKMWPLYNGGLNGNGEYEFLVGTSLRLQEINSASLQRTDTDLTFTGS